MTKKRMNAGEILVGIGTDEIKGVAVSATDARSKRWAPAGMMEGCRLKRDVGTDERIRLDDIEPPADSALWRLRSFV